MVDVEPAPANISPATFQQQNMPWKCIRNLAFKAYYRLMLSGERKSVESMAGRVSPTRFLRTTIVASLRGRGRLER